MTEAADQGQESVKDRVAAVVAKIRPMIQADGGDLEFVNIDQDGVVQVRLHGACRGCPSAQMTLKLGVERNLMEHVPEVTEVVCVP
ncbi:MAG: NifU family protein [Phycisphaerae bacterium]|nr:NifU family protein [Phycisphaerae bacterium]